MKPLLTLTIAFLILLAPMAAFAQGGIIPCGQTEANPCNTCDVVVLANSAIKWLIGITFMIFAAMAVYAGVKMVISSGNSHALQDAKDMFTNAFIGLFIILAAWLMIDTLLRYVLKNGETGNIDGYGPWSEVKCVTQATPGITQMMIKEDEFNPIAVVSGGTSVSPVAVGQMTSLKAAGVNVANWPGITGPGRTDLAHPSVVTATLWMQNEGKRRFGKTPFQVTAAYTNGVGHSNGSQHYKGTAVDLQPINGVTYDQIIQLCKQAKFTYVNDERSSNHIHCDMR